MKKLLTAMALAAVCAIIGCESGDGGNGGFVAVTDISGVPAAAAAGTDLTLAATVTPPDATNKAIVWTVKSAGTTGASIVDGNTLRTTAAGSVTLTATIANGLGAGAPFVKDFTITASAGNGDNNDNGNTAFVPVADISGVSNTAIASIDQTLGGAAAPANATNQVVVWTVKSAGTTGASIVDGNKLRTSAAGGVTLTATIANGLGADVLLG